jgi:hypothetical protein
VEQATWQVETTWYDLGGDDAPKMASSSEGVVRDPVEVLGIGELAGDILRPAVEEPLEPPVPQSVEGIQTDFQVIDTSCPFCMTPGRSELETAWMRDGADTMNIMAVATARGMIAYDVNPSVSRIHFDDHFKPEDHFRIHGR